MVYIENIVMSGVEWFISATGLASVLIIAAGTVVTSYKVLQMMRSPDLKKYNQARLTFSRYLVMGLEFLLAADIIATAVRPTWSDLGMLVVIAAVRTFLNFFLQLEMKEEERAVRSGE
jgi:uncharacterized membrane protein